MDSIFYTLPEIAAYLKVSISTVRRAVKAGKIDVARIGTLGQIRVSSDSFNRYLAASQEQQGLPKLITKPASNRTRAHATPTIATQARKTRAMRELAGDTHCGTRWRLLNGDARTSLNELTPSSIDCVVTSPPYYWQRDYEVEGQLGHEASIEEYVQAIASVFREVRRALADNGTVFLNLGDTYYSAKGKPHGRDDKHKGRQMMRRHLRAVDGPGLGLPRKSLIGIPWRVALAMQADGWILRSAVLWQRVGSPPEPTARDRPWRSYEHIFIFAKTPRYYFERRGLKGEEDIWRITARPENPNSHAAPYPRELVERCLDLGCKPGGTVLDPFVGSGTTMLSALARKSPAIGIELNAKYCEAIIDRIMNEFSQGSQRLVVPR